MGDTTATRQGHQFSRIHGRRHVRYFIYVFSKILHGTAVDKTDFPLNIRIFVFIPIRKFFEFPYQNFSQLVLRHGEYPRAMPASLLQCHRLQCAARALLRRALRSGHVAALGPFRGARAMLLRSGHAAALGPASLAVALLFPSVLRLVCAGLFAMGHIGIQAPPGSWFGRCTQEPKFH